jgi:hypothetical protein
MHYTQSSLGDATSNGYDDTGYAIDLSPPPLVTVDLSDAMAKAMNDTAPGILDKAAAIKMPGEDTIAAISRAMTGLTMTLQQRELMNLNIERAKKGLPPIDISQYSGVGVNVGLSSSTQQMILMLGGGLLLYMLLAKK